MHIDNSTGLSEFNFRDIWGLWVLRKVQLRFRRPGLEEDRQFLVLTDRPTEQFWQLGCVSFWGRMVNFFLVYGNSSESKERLRRSDSAGPASLDTGPIQHNMRQLGGQKGYLHDDFRISAGIDVAEKITRYSSCIMHSNNLPRRNAKA